MGNWFSGGPQPKIVLDGCKVGKEQQIRHDGVSVRMDNCQIGGDQDIQDSSDPSKRSTDLKVKITRSEIKGNQNIHHNDAALQITGTTIGGRQLLLDNRNLKDPMVQEAVSID